MRCAAHGGLAHEGALAGIAVAAAAEHAPQLPASRLGQRRQGLQGLVQGIGCVCVVHHHGGL
jgi:hypothetical protein